MIKHFARIERIQIFTHKTGHLKTSDNEPKIPQATPRRLYIDGRNREIRTTRVDSENEKVPSVTSDNFTIVAILLFLRAYSLYF